MECATLSEVISWCIFALGTAVALGLSIAQHNRRELESLFVRYN